MGFRYLWVKEDGTVMGTDNDELSERLVDADEFIVDTEDPDGEIKEFKDEDFPAETD